MNWSLAQYWLKQHLAAHSIQSATNTSSLRAVKLSWLDKLIMPIHAHVLGEIRFSFVIKVDQYVGSPQNRRRQSYFVKSKSVIFMWPTVGSGACCQRT